MRNGGFSIIEVMIAAAIGFTIMLATITLTVAQQREIKRLGQKLSLQDIDTQIRRVASDGAKCLFNINPNGTTTFDSTNIPDSSLGTVLPQSLLTPPALYDGTVITARKIVTTNAPVKGVPGITVEKIGLTNWVKNGSPDDFTADLIVPLTSDSGAMGPLKILGINIKTNPASGIGAKSPTSCILSSASSGGGSSGSLGKGAVAAVASCTGIKCVPTCPANTSAALVSTETFACTQAGKQGNNIVFKCPPEKNTFLCLQN